MSFEPVLRMGILFEMRDGNEKVMNQETEDSIKHNLSECVFTNSVAFFRSNFP